MRFRHFFATALCIVFLAACDQKNAADKAQADAGSGQTPTTDTSVAPVSTATGPAQATVDRGDIDFVELPLDGSSNQPHSLAEGQSISGEFEATKAGSVIGVEIQVGNYANSSVGTLSLKLCRGTACAEGTADLTASKDNEYFYVQFAAPLQLEANGQPVTYMVTRVSGENNFALWSYPASVQTSKLTLPDGAVLPRTLKVGLRYSR